MRDDGIHMRQYSEVKYVQARRTQTMGCLASHLVVVDIDVEQLVLVHEVGEGEEERAEGHEQWRDARVRHHDHRHHQQLAGKERQTNINADRQS